MTEVVIRYRRRFPYPLADCYAWLTDYQDDDPDRTSRIVKKRPVLERTADKVVLDGTVEVLGKRRTGRVEVHLRPPDHWEAHFPTGNHGAGTVYVYHLTPEGAGCRLDVEYRFRIRRLRRRVQYTLLKPVLWLDIHRMWNGFAASMAEDFAAGTPSPSAGLASARS